MHFHIQNIYDNVSSGPASVLFPFHCYSCFGGQNSRVVSRALSLRLISNMETSESSAATPNANKQDNVSLRSVKECKDREDKMAQIFDCVTHKDTDFSGFKYSCLILTSS